MADSSQQRERPVPSGFNKFPDICLLLHGVMASIQVPPLLTPRSPAPWRQAGSSIVGPTPARVFERIRTSHLGATPAVRAQAVEALGPSGTLPRPSLVEVTAATVDHLLNAPSLPKIRLEDAAACRGGHAVKGVRLRAEALVLALRDDDAAVRATAAKTLGLLAPTLGNDKELGTRALARLLADDQNPSVCEAAFAALAELGPVAGAVGVQAFVEDLWLNTSPEFRCRTAAALGDLGPAAGHEGVHALIASLASEVEPSVRQAAARALGRMRCTAGADGVHMLILALRNDEDAPVRCEAANSLAFLGPTWTGPDVVPALVATLTTDGNADVQLAAASALEEHGASALPHLLPCLERGKHPRMRLAALDSLRALADSKDASSVVREHGALLQCIAHHHHEPGVPSAMMDIFVALGDCAGPALPGLLRLAQRPPDTESENAEDATDGASALATHILAALFEDHKLVFESAVGARAVAFLSLRRRLCLESMTHRGEPSPGQRSRTAREVRQAVGLLKRRPLVQHRRTLSLLPSPAIVGHVSRRTVLEH